ncbi:DUF2958 domain-containing protein [Bosea sp. NPDC055353]
MLAIPENLRHELLENGRLAKIDQHIDPLPVLKFFCPWDRRTWLVSEMSPDDNDILFGLADLDDGEPEVGMIVLSELAAEVGIGGLRIEVDRFFRPNRTLNEYASDAAIAGRFVA